MRGSVTLALALLSACAAEVPPAPGSTAESRAIDDRTLVIGQHLRAALACGIAVPDHAQDRAGALESAALAWRQEAGGPEARDAWLQALLPPSLSPSHHAAWCMEHGPDVLRVLHWLDSAEGGAFARRAVAVEAR